MKCSVIKHNGVAAILCGPRRIAACAKCGEIATKECDFVVQRAHAGNHKLCDKPLCDRCAVSVGKNKDYCPDHPMTGTQMALL